MSVPGAKSARAEDEPRVLARHGKLGIVLKDATPAVVMPPVVTQ
jgi:hypothetical protein